jgi:hypothetical protein
MLNKKHLTIQPIEDGTVNKHKIIIKIEISQGTMEDK